MVPEPLLEAINVRLDTLGYEAMSPAWNTAPRRGRHAGAASERLAALMETVDLAAIAGSEQVGSFAVVAEDDDMLRWVIDPSTGGVRQGDGEVECVITGTAADLALMLERKENLGVLLRGGRIRHLTAGDNLPPEELARAMSIRLSLLTGTMGQGRPASC